MTRIVLLTASVFIGIYLLAMALLYFRQDHLVFPADKVPLGDPRPIAGAHTAEVTTSDGLVLKGWFKPPGLNAPVIVYLHGNAGSLNNRVHRLGQLAEGNTGLFGVEYRGYADNPGKPSEVGLVRDAAAAMVFLKNQGIQNRQIVLYGESLGTNVAVQTALAFSVAGVILDSPYTSIADVAAKRYPYAPVRMLIRNRFDTLGRIGGLKVPVLVMRTTQDRTVPPSESLAVYQAAPEPKQIWTITGGTHSTLIENGGLAVVRRFIERICPLF